MPIDQLEILLVEDNPVDVLLLRDALEKHLRTQYRLLVAEDGDEAIRFYEKNRAVSIPFRGPTWSCST